MASGGGVLFFGVDCPDVPAEVLGGIGGIGGALGESDAVIGPVSDGGYWTLGCGRYLPGLLEGIDWGTPRVYDQTCAAAAAMGVSLSALPAWHDVDEMSDLETLLQRLENPGEPALQVLAERLHEVLENSP